jgi:hypothetical protein
MKQLFRAEAGEWPSNHSVIRIVLPLFLGLMVPDVGWVRHGEPNIVPHYARLFAAIS